MTTKIIALTLTAVLLLCQPLFAFGQSASEPQPSWAAVQALSAKVKLQVETRDGNRIKGLFASATETTLTLNGKSGTINFNRDDVQKVYQLRGGSRAKTALIGAGIGAGAGAGLALALLGATNGSDDFNGILGQGIAIGAGIGATLGALAGKNSRRVLIYESK